jgi:hypothetical protein
MNSHLTVTILFLQNFPHNVKLQNYLILLTKDLKNKEKYYSVSKL